MNEGGVLEVFEVWQGRGKNFFEIILVLIVIIKLQIHAIREDSNCEFDGLKVCVGNVLFDAYFDSVFCPIKGVLVIARVHSHWIVCKY